MKIALLTMLALIAGIAQAQELSSDEVIAVLEAEESLTVSPERKSELEAERRSIENKLSEYVAAEFAKVCKDRGYYENEPLRLAAAVGEIDAGFYALRAKLAKEAHDKLTGTEKVELANKKPHIVTEEQRPLDPSLTTKYLDKMCGSELRSHLSSLQ